MKNRPDLRDLSLKINSQMEFLLSAIIFTVFNLAILNYSIRANRDNSKGRFQLFMDEQITFDGVRKILHPESIFMFCYSVLDGGDQRYGRLLWNISAVTSFIPEKLFGETGQIVATRTISVVLLLVAAALLAKTFGHRPYVNVLIYATVLSLPFVSYYITMPKPEPLQLLLLAILAYRIVNQSDFGSRRLYLLLGMLLGVKISSLALILPIVFWLLTKTPRDQIEQPNWFSWKLGAFNLGMSIAVPTLFPFLGVITLFVFLWERKLKRMKSPAVTFIVTLIFSASTTVLLGRFFEILLGRDFLMNYINYTILGTSSGSDSWDVTPVSWIKYFLSDWNSLPLLPSILFLLSLTLIVFSFIKNRKSYNQRVEVYVFAAAGTLSILLTFVNVQRIWGFYLFIGTSIFAASAIGLITDWVTTQRQEKHIKFAYAIFVCLLIWFTAASLKDNFEILQSQSMRTQSEEYGMQLKSYETIRSTIINYTNENPGTYSAALDPNYFQIDKLPSVTFERFWGPFSGWGNYDFLIFKPSHLPPFENMAIGTNEEEAKSAEVKNYYRYFVENPELCSNNFCYTTLIELPDKGKIMLKVSGRDND